MHCNNFDGTCHSTHAGSHLQPVGVGLSSAAAGYMGHPGSFWKVPSIGFSEGEEKWAAHAGERRSLLLKIIIIWSFFNEHIHTLSMYVFEILHFPILKT